MCRDTLHLSHAAPTWVAHPFDLGQSISCAFPNDPLVTGGDHANRRQMP
jgi:hypothetical protein